MSNKLKVGNKYWILDGRGNPQEVILQKIVNDGKTAVFYSALSIVRKVTSVYLTKAEAIKKKILNYFK
jgi:hypothetical protein